MTFPANYAVIAEDELTYVTGGGVIANVLPAVMTSENWRTFSVNMIKIIGNSFMTPVINATLGVMFVGSWGDGESLFGEDGTISSYYTGKQTVLNKIMGTLGGLATIYTLGTNDAKTKHNDSVVSFDL